MDSPAIKDLLALLNMVTRFGYNSIFYGVTLQQNDRSSLLDAFQKRKDKGYLEDLQKCYYEEVSIDEQGLDDEGRNREEYLLAYEPNGNTLNILTQDIATFTEKAFLFVADDPLLNQIFEVTSDELSDTKMVVVRDGVVDVDSGRIDLDTLSTFYSHIVDVKYPSLESYALWLLGRLRAILKERKSWDREMKLYEYVYYYLWVHKRSDRKNKEEEEKPQYKFVYKLTQLAEYRDVF